MRKAFLCRSFKTSLLFMLVFNVAKMMGMCNPNTPVLWHNLSDVGCGVGQTNPGITADVVDQNIDVIGVNALVDGIQVRAETCDILVTITNADSVITGSGNRCDGVPTGPARLYLFADTGRTITFRLDFDLLFRGTANGAALLDLLVSFSGGGQVIFDLGDDTVVTFGSEPTSGGTQFLIAMDQADETFENVIFQRQNTNSVADVEVVIGDRSAMTFISEAAPFDGNANVLFDPQNEDTGEFILRLEPPCAGLVIAGHLIPDLDTEFLISDVDFTTIAGLQATVQIGNPSFNGQPTPGDVVCNRVRVINGNICCTPLFIDPFCQGPIAGPQAGFVLGPVGLLIVNNFSYLDYIGTATNICCDFVLPNECGVLTPQSRLRNGSAFIVDGLDDQTPSQIQLLGRSAIYFRSGVDKCGTVFELGDFVINGGDRSFEEFKNQCAGNIVFDVEGPLDITGLESAPGAGDNVNGINILSLEVTCAGCPVLVGDTGPALFPARTFARNGLGEYLRYNSGAMLVNNRVNLITTNLMHTDENHDVYQQGNLGNPNLSSEPTYIGGDTYLLCMDQVEPAFARTQCRPFIAFINSAFHVNTSVASVGVDWAVPNSGLGGFNVSTFIFYNNGRCIDAGYGRNMILGTSPCFDGCFTSTNQDSHLDVMQKDGTGGTQTLLLQTAMNDACITEGIEPGDTGDAVQTIYLNNNSNISVGILGTTAVDCFGTPFEVTPGDVESTLGVISPCFSFETRGGVLGYPQSSGTTGQGGIFVDTNALFTVADSIITNVGAMVTKSGNGIINLPQRSVFFDARVGIQDWRIDLSNPNGVVVVDTDQSLSDYSLDWGSVIKNYCCTSVTLTATCFIPYQVEFTPDDCNCPAVTPQNLTSLPIVRGTVEQFQVIRSRICDQIHLLVDGGFIRELIFLVGFNSAEAPVGFFVLQNDARVGLGSAHKNVDSLEASIVLGVNGVQLCANGNGTVILNEDVIINNVCHILSGTNFGIVDQERLRIYSAEPRSLRIKSTGTLDLTQFDSPNKVLEIGGQVSLIAEPGARIILNNGSVLQFTDQAKFILSEVLQTFDDLEQPSDSDDIRVRMSGQGTVIFSDDSSMIVGQNTYFGIETFQTCSAITTLTFLLTDQASIEIGSQELPGGAFQIGNTTGVEGAAIDFTLQLNGVGAVFQVDRQGFLGFATGVVDKQAQIPDLWTVGCLQNVRSITVDIVEGTFIHDQIAPGSDSIASLFAISDDPDMLLTFNFDIDPAIGAGGNSVIRGGGNLEFYTFEAFEGGCTTLNPTDVLVSGTTVTADGTIQSGIMAGKMLLVDPTKGAQPVNVTPQQLFDYLKTDLYAVPAFKRANITSNNLNELTLGYVRDNGLTFPVERPVINPGSVGTVGGNPTEADHSLRIGAVSFLVNQSNNALSSINELVGAGSY